MRSSQADPKSPANYRVYPRISCCSFASAIGYCPPMWAQPFSPLTYKYPGRMSFSCSTARLHITAGGTNYQWPVKVSYH